MRSFFGLAGFFSAVIVALLADLQGGVRSPYVLVEMAAGMMVGFTFMTDADRKVINFFKDLGQLRFMRM